LLGQISFSPASIITNKSKVFKSASAHGSICNLAASVIMFTSVIWSPVKASLNKAFNNEYTSSRVQVGLFCQTSEIDALWFEGSASTEE
jgi:hypothetical protein